jgi:cytochrome P450
MAITVSNMLMYLSIQPELYKKARDEIDSVLVAPYLQAKGKKHLDFNEIGSLVNIENQSDLRFLSNCYNESLRMDTAVHASSSMMFT